MLTVCVYAHAVGVWLKPQSFLYSIVCTVALVMHETDAAETLKIPTYRIIYVEYFCFSFFSFAFCCIRSKSLHGFLYSHSRRNRYFFSETQNGPERRARASSSFEHENQINIDACLSVYICYSR